METKRSDIIEAVSPVIQAFKQLGIPYYKALGERAKLGRFARENIRLKPIILKGTKTICARKHKFFELARLC